MESNFILNSFRTIISAIDRAIYGLISFLYEIMEILARHELFSADVIDSFATRVYTLLGLIMVFKVTFSLINYLVNPDMINDKTQGAGNIAKNIVITLVLIIVTPYLFDFGYKLQNAILDDNVLPRLILETEDTSSASLEIIMDPNVCKDKRTYADNYGDYMAIMTLRPFYQFDKDVLSRNRNSDVENAYCYATNTGTLLQSSIYKADEGVISQNNVGSYLIDYSMILSTVAGVVVALLLLTLCMDVAVRTIKLAFLEIVAPIPIISYIDPKSGKDGIFKKWYKEVIRTWAGLFVKLTAIYFAIYVISLIGTADLSSEEHGVWIMLFLILGALMFAKQFTKLIEDIFGIKLDGMGLHPIKKIQEQAAGGKAITNFGSGVVGAAGGAIAGARAGYNAGALGRGIAVGAMTGFSNGKGDKKPFTTGMNKTYKNLTGNDMVNMTPTSLLMGLGSKANNRVGEVKDALKIANERLRNEETRLNNAAYLSSRASEVLSKYKIDPNNMKSSNSYIKDAEVLEEKNKNIENRLELYNKAKNYVNSYTPSKDANGNDVYDQRYIDYKKLVDKYDSTGMVSQFENALEINRQNIDKNRSIAEAVDNFRTSMDAQQKARKAIADINKEISTLSDEKKQRQTFWQVDTSPKKSVKEALANNQPPVTNGIDYSPKDDDQ
ncbi:MAG: hypothetical protein J6G98_01020 [Bacilli bacterium]|nr:hypothetical protein [Bacilli bacterium]